MLDALKKIPPIGWSGLTALLFLAATAIAGHYSDSQGRVSLSKERAIQVCGAAGSLFVGVSVLAWSYWRKEQKREKIAFALAHHRIVCQCTETGEITLVEDVKIDDRVLGKVVKCPVCRRSYDIPEKALPGVAFL